MKYALISGCLAGEKEDGGIGGQKSHHVVGDMINNGRYLIPS